MVSTQQTMAIMNATVDAIVRTKPEPEPNYWWIPIVVAGVTILGGIVTALIRRKK